MLTIGATRGDYRVHFTSDKGTWHDVLLAECTSLKPSSIVLCSNPIVFELYGESLQILLEQHYTVHTWLFPDGELNKNLQTVVEAIQGLDAFALDRKAICVALGGGVVGDLTGFVASMLLRGLRWIQCPTTLLAMVDSSVGGKTGCNLPSGKNRLGAIYSPDAVVAPLFTLQSLAVEEMWSGWGECMKHVLLGAPDSLRTVQEMHQRELLQQPYQYEEFSNFLEMLCSVKARVVSMDEFEKGWRATLNLGHTIGHGLEKILKYGTITHGYAVLLGMLCEISWLHQSEMHVADEVIRILEEFIKNVDMSIEIGDTVTALTLFDAISFDKKMQCDKLTMVGLKTLGEPVLLEIDRHQQWDLCCHSVELLNSLQH